MAGTDNSKKYIKNKKAFIETELKKYLNEHGDIHSTVFKAMKYGVLSGGKRVRPLLCIESCCMCGGTIRQAVPAACSIEFIHNFSLVHDDLPSMDDDALRRGNPTVHKKFGEGIAVLAGDALLTLAFRVLSDIRDGKILREIIGEVTQATGINGMIGGQGLDIEYMNKKKSPNLRAKINTLKTARLFSAALRTGAIAASASPAHLKSISMYGVSFGRAFQIRDDIHDGDYKKEELGARKKSLRKEVKKAKISLNVFGKRADNLKNIADWLIKGI